MKITVSDYTRWIKNWIKETPKRHITCLVLSLILYFATVLTLAHAVGIDKDDSDSALLVGSCMTIFISWMLAHFIEPVYNLLKLIVDKLFKQ